MPRPWQGKNRQRLKRELPFQSRQRQAYSPIRPVSISADIASISTLSTTEKGAWSAVANEGLQGFPQGQVVVASGPATTFVPATAIGAWSALANEGLQGAPQGQVIVAVGPNTTFVPATATMAMAVSAAIVSTSSLIAIALGGAPEVLPIGGPYRQQIPVHQPAPPPRVHIPVHLSLEPTVVETRPLEPVIAEGAADNQEALVALYASGALSDVEFAALIAA